MSDFLSSDAIPFTTSGLRKAGLDPPPTGGTRNRWWRKGIRGYKLTTFLRGGRRYVTKAALEEFFAAVNAAAEGAAQRSASGGRANREPRYAKAEAELDSDGSSK